MGGEVIRTVIVEDDLMVAAINRQYISLIPEMAVTAVFHNSKDAWTHISQTDTDLVILDEYMPGMTGLELLANLRVSGCKTDAIMVTAANDAGSLETALRLGVVDYLVKPFSSQRFKEAIQKYLAKRQMLKVGSSFDQTAIDHMIGQLNQLTESELAKGLQERTLKKITGLMGKNCRAFVTCEEMAGMSGLSQVTVRRYLNYLIERNEVLSEVDYQTGGRPSIKYRWVGDSR